MPNRQVVTMLNRKMRLTASSFYTLCRPSVCELRVYLEYKGIEQAPVSPFDEVIRILGQRHELQHLASFSAYIDLSDGTEEQRKNKTIQEIQKKSPVIYQSVLTASVTFDGVMCEVVGYPDYLILDNGQYKIRDSKMSRRITERDHPEIIYQLQIYGWLYEQVVGKPPQGLEVHAGNGDLVEVSYDGGTTALNALKDISKIRIASSEPYSPVGWSKCSGCGYFQLCWPQAEKRKDVALVDGVDQGLAWALKKKGVESVDQLISDFNIDELSDFKRPWGTREQRVGKKAESILRMAQSLSDGKEYLIASPNIPPHANYAMFDLEGLPPHLDEIEKIYLWGIQVFGEKQSAFLAATAGFGIDGDKEGWETFLANAKSVFDEYGDIPFVHWHHYERVKIDMYTERFGDRSGIAERVKSNLLDLLPITRNSIALPLPSYSLKVIEKYIGYKRTQDEYGGNWAIAKYIEATETEDVELRENIMSDILKYNLEDLEATWEVLKWLMSKSKQ